MPRVILLNKPYGVICQFSPSGERATLKDFVPVPRVYPAGRLDTDSEGLIVLTDDAALQAKISDPRHKLQKGYWAQVEGVASSGALERLRRGVELNDGITLPAGIHAIGEPQGLWDRVPPIRRRANIPTTWLEVVLREGRNRQVRRMTAAVGLPTLRLVRFRVGPWSLQDLAPGEWREISPLSTSV
jgi:23S rRNA pseudouridine2457 synthase